ncbi:MAG: thioredoxin family protein [Acidobacteriota bacterium]
MFDQREEELIRVWHDGLAGEVQLRAIVPGSPAGDRVRAFAERLGTLASRVRVSMDLGRGAERPVILVGSRLRCLGAPQGTALGPFLEALQRFGTVAATRDAGDTDVRGLEGADVRVYVSPHCPHCPVATRELLRLLELEPRVTLTIVDAELFPELAASDRVRSVPTVLVAHQYRSTGDVAIDEILRALHGAAPDSDVIGRLLDGGDADSVAAMMVESGNVFPAVLDRIAHDAMTFRLGAMAAMERLIETAPDVARRAEAGLWERVAGASREATGDLLYVIGEAGTSASVPWLETFYDTTRDDDLREAVADALARIAERTE